MLKVTLMAVEKSIKKWDGIAHGKEADCLANNCALCHRFLYEKRKDSCPLQESGDNPCRGECCKEWNAWIEHHYDEHGVSFRRVEGCRKCDLLSEAMYQKLVGLLKVANK